jgi:hypothetical protein
MDLAQAAQLALPVDPERFPVAQPVAARIGLELPASRTKLSALKCWAQILQSSLRR